MTADQIINKFHNWIDQSQGIIRGPIQPNQELYHEFKDTLHALEQLIREYEGSIEYLKIRGGCIE